MTDTDEAAVGFELLSAGDWPTIRDDYGDLARAVANPHAFYLPVGVEAAMALAEADRPTHVLLARSGPGLRLCFAWPVRIEVLGGLQVLHGYGAPQVAADHLEPLDLTGGAATRALLEGRAGLGIDVVVAATASDALALAAATVRGAYESPAFSCPFTQLPTDPVELLAQLRPKMRSNIRRAEARCAAAGISIRVMTEDQPGHTMTDALDRLRGLHVERAEATGRASRFDTEPSLAFHGLLCARASNQPGTIWFVEALLDGEVVGSLYGLVAGRRFWFYQSGFRPDLTDVAVGTVLIHRTMLELMDRGIEVFDFLRGTEQYKTRWMSGANQDHMLMVPTSTLGRVGVRVLRLRRAIKRFGRRVGILRWVRGTD